MPLVIVKTGDGSNTLRKDPEGIHYHSIHGAITESRHVFIKEGLDHWKNLQSGVTELKVLEVGFGTGLNAALACSWANQEQLRLKYWGLEPYPVPAEIWVKMEYEALLPEINWENWRKVYSGWLHDQVLNWGEGQHQFQVYPHTIENWTPLEEVDIVFFDAFAQTAQQELWTEPVMEKLVSCLRPGGVWVSYGITGRVKRALQQLGLTTERPAGAPGKRHMLRATRLGKQLLPEEKL